MNHSNYRTISAIVLTAFTILSAGCGKEPNPDGREDVSGKITLNGLPLSGRSDIHFISADNNHANDVYTQIKVGEYLLTGHDGVKPGKYIVRISSVVDFDRSTGKLADNTIEFGNEVTVSVIPPQFNKESKIEFTVEAGKSNKFDYDIETDFTPSMPKTLPKAQPKM